MRTRTTAITASVAVAALGGVVRDRLRAGAGRVGHRPTEPSRSAPLPSCGSPTPTCPPRRPATSCCPGTSTAACAQVTPYGWEDLPCAHDVRRRWATAADCPRDGIGGGDAADDQPGHQQRHRHQHPGGRRRRARHRQDRRPAPRPGRRRPRDDVRRHRRAPRAAGDHRAARDEGRRDPARRRHRRGGRAGRRAESPSDAYAIPRQDTRVVVLDVSDPGAPVVTDTFVTNTDLQATRQTGDTVRLVLGSRLPDLDFVEPGRWRSDDRALEQNRDRVRESSIEDWLPTVTSYDADGDGSRRGRSSTATRSRCRAPRPGLGTMVVAGFDAAEPTDWDVSAVATASDVVYMSTDRLYLATGSWWSPWPVFAEPGVTFEGDLAGDARGRHHPALLVRPRGDRHALRRLRRGRRPGRRPVVDGRVGRRPARGGRPDLADRRLQLGPHPGRGRRRPGPDRPPRQARGQRGDQVRALVRRPRDRGDLPADRPAVRGRPVDPGPPAADRRAQGPRLLGVPAPARPAAPPRTRHGRGPQRHDPRRAGGPLHRPRPRPRAADGRRPLRHGHDTARRRTTPASSPGCPTSAPPWP